MTLMEETLKSALATLTSRTVYALQIPAGAALPCISYKRISHNVDRALAGGTGLSHTRYEVNVWASTYASCLAEANKIIAGLNGNYTTFKTSWVLNAQDVIENQEVPLYRSIIDVMVLN